MQVNRLFYPNIHYLLRNYNNRKDYRVQSKVESDILFNIENQNNLPVMMMLPMMLKKIEINSFFNK